MVVLEVHTRAIKVKYKSFLLSKATFIAVFCHVVSVILPFILCYSSKGFWKKHDISYHQPNVKVQGDYLFIATTNDDLKPISCSTYPQYNKYVKSFDACSSIKIRESDQNLDGKADSLYFQLSAKFLQNIKVTSMNIVIPINITLQEPCFFHMQTAIMFQYNFAFSSKISVYGELDLLQTKPIECANYVKAKNKYNRIIEDYQDFNSYSLESIVSKLAENFVKPHLKNTLITFDLTKDETFSATFHIKYGQQGILYKPGFWQILKFAWIQYLSIYIIVYKVIFEIKRYIFENNLVLLYEDKSNINK
ncbi:transmembrane protein 231 [Anthonomus grandis grandis]|uniref:transmembrane protein 231 n=1 Tax=Anthonomus grandis grandis TaxID=2921223 RepID=UPI002164F511|nr:transmembrane protein 231 [Anthonomus grandis grandis]